MTYRHVPHCRLVIGLLGASRHGKDTAAKAILKALPGAERFAFSDAVSAVARVCHGMTARDPRLLQTVGNRGREGQPAIWLDALYGSIVDREPEIAVVTGLRFREEVDMIRALAPQSTILRITRLTAEGKLFVSDDRDPNSPTEVGIAGLPADVELVAQSGDIVGLGRQAQDWLSTCRAISTNG